MSTIDPAALRARATDAISRANAAPDGPWHDDGYRVYLPTSDPNPCNGVVLVEHKHSDADGHQEAGKFIAAARTDVPALGADVIALADEVERLREYVTALESQRSLLREMIGGNGRMVGT